MEQEGGVDTISLVAIVGVTLTGTPLVMVDMLPLYDEGAFVLHISREGNPVHGSQVVLTHPDGRKLRFSSNRSGYAVPARQRKLHPIGKYKATLDSGSYVFTVGATGRQHRVQIPIGETVEKRIRLGEAAEAEQALLSEENKAPIARIAALAPVAPGARVYLDGRGSFDPDRDTLHSEIASYRWRLTAQPANSNSYVADERAARAMIVPDVAGSYTLRLTVSDGVLQDHAKITIKCAEVPKLVKLLPVSAPPVESFRVVPLHGKPKPPEVDTGE